MAVPRTAGGDGKLLRAARGGPPLMMPVTQAAIAGGPAASAGSAQIAPEDRVRRVEDQHVRAEQVLDVKDTRAEA